VLVNISLYENVSECTESNQVLAEKAAVVVTQSFITKDFGKLLLLKAVTSLKAVNSYSSC